MEIQSDLFDGLNLLNNLAQMLESPSEWTRLNSVLKKKLELSTETLTLQNVSLLPRETR